MMHKSMAYGHAKEPVSRVAVPQSPLDAGLGQIPPGSGPGESLKAVESRGHRIIVRRRHFHPFNPLFKYRAASDERRSFFATPASVDFLYQRGGFFVCRMDLSQEPRERGWSDLQQCVHRAGGGSAVVRPALPASL